MAFKRIVGMIEGSYVVEIIKAEVVTFKDGRLALKITVRTVEEETLEGVFYILIDNTFIINKLVDITYEEEIGDEVDENDFIGIYMEIITKKKDGYLNIVNINPVEFEEA